MIALQMRKTASIRSRVLAQGMGWRMGRSTEWRCWLETGSQAVHPAQRGGGNAGVGRWVAVVGGASGSPRWKQTRWQRRTRRARHQRGRERGVSAGVGRPGSARAP